jgi:hypothetical protein
MTVSATRTAEVLTPMIVLASPTTATVPPVVRLPVVGVVLAEGALALVMRVAEPSAGG